VLRDPKKLAGDALANPSVLGRLPRTLGCIFIAPRAGRFAFSALT
jgi:hypothetical protein